MGYEMDTTCPVQARLNNLQALLRYIFMSFFFVSSPERIQCAPSEVYTDVFHISIRKRLCLSYKVNIVLVI